jgi:hypothetical protein
MENVNHPGILKRDMLRFGMGRGYKDLVRRTKSRVGAVTRSPIFLFFFIASDDTLSFGDVTLR